MIRTEKDPTMRNLLMQLALKDLGLYTGELDNWWGPRSQDALEAYQKGFAPAPQVPLTRPNLHRDISATGIELIKHFEGLYLEAYQDEVGVWTIGWGHTGLTHKDGTVHKGRMITRAEAEDLLRYDMDVFEGRVESLVTVPLNDGQFAALVAWDFNTGGLRDSSLRRILNSGDYKGAADQLLRWDKAGGKTLRGLTRRRKSERNMFLGIEPAIVPA